MRATRAQTWWDRWDFLAPDVRHELGRLIAQLQRGLISAGAPDNPDEPAGWSGLTRRGPWSRLLPSEWALAEAAPEEFLRRASEGELGFWQLEHETSSQKRCAWLWLDAGPDQLGACRVVQIALMLWLQAACLDSGGSFFWGVVQAQEKGYDQLTADELRTFLNARSIEPARRPPERFDGIQTWCVGGAAWVSTLPAGFERVTLTQISVETVELTYGARRLELRMPPASMAGRLLRDPFSWSVLPTRRPGGSFPAGKLAFSDSGTKLLLAGEHQVTVLPIPSSANEPPGRPRVYPLRFEGPVVALSMEGKAINVTQLDTHEWALYRLNPGIMNRKAERVTVPAEGAASDLGACWKHDDHWGLWVGDTLYQLRGGDPRVVFQTRGGCRAGKVSVLITARNVMDINGYVHHTFEQPCQGRAHVMNGAHLRVKGTVYVMAVELEDARWRLHWQEKSAVLQASGNVIGVVPDYHRDEIGLLVENDGRLAVQCPTGGWSLQIDGQITEWRVHPDGLLGFRTVTGQLGCYVFAERQVRWLPAP